MNMLQEFKNDIYPRKLWIATSWEDVKTNLQLTEAMILRNQKTHTLLLIHV